MRTNSRAFRLAVGIISMQHGGSLNPLLPSLMHTRCVGCVSSSNNVFTELYVDEASLYSFPATHITFNYSPLDQSVANCCHTWGGAIPHGNPMRLSDFNRAGVDCCVTSSDHQCNADHSYLHSAGELALLAI